MANYIIINGVDSRSITGLLIQELPPVVKPVMRSQFIEVDGRDGDSVLALGYGAYDKTASIGLHGGFDIDAVSAFFSGSGEVVFSNEPDKIYRFDQVSQIEYERLVRFRTAEVKFHVQPVKRSGLEHAVSISAQPYKIKNAGNTPAMPTLTVTGTGNVTLAYDGTDVLTIAFGALGATVVIDVEACEAYDPVTMALLNRSITGDYDDLILATGPTVITWTGMVSSLTIDNYSAWI